MDAFEEVVKVEDIARLSDPLKERLLEIVRNRRPSLSDAAVSCHQQGASTWPVSKSSTVRSGPHHSHP